MSQLEQQAAALESALALQQPGIPTMYGTAWCGDCRRTERIFQQMGVPFVKVDIEQDDAARELVLSINGGAQVIPVVVFDAFALIEPPAHVVEAAIQGQLSTSEPAKE